jgi:peptide/nickel transport system permease protein
MRFVRAIIRPLVLLLLIEGATLLMVRVAPGYFTDPSALDPRLSEHAIAQMQAEKAAANPLAESVKEDVALLAGKLGESRYYHVPVGSLIGPRWPVTMKLLAGGLGLGWIAALLASIPTVLATTPEHNRLASILAIPVVVLIAVPAGAMAALAVTSGYGTPVLIIALFTGPRVFQFLSVILKKELYAEHVRYARALGLTTRRIVLAHVLPCAAPELLATFGTSLVIGLGALVPVEVMFDLPGVAQLAWTAAINRDAPVIAATTLVAAGAVAVAAILSDCFARPGTRIVQTRVSDLALGVK